MPPTVSRILVSPGESVRHGDSLILLEAMKMELALEALRDGTIDDIACAEGDLVQPGGTLVRMRQEV